jgi:hypothetical protein
VIARFDFCAATIMPPETDIFDRSITYVELSLRDITQDRELWVVVLEPTPSLGQTNRLRLSRRLHEPQAAIHCPTPNWLDTEIILQAELEPHGSSKIVRFEFT